MDSGILIYYKEIISVAVSAVIGTIVTVVVKRQFALRDKKDLEIQKLIEEKEQMKEEAIREWRNTYVRGQDSIRNKVELIIEKMNEKVSRSECHDNLTELKEAVKLLDERIR